MNDRFNIRYFNKNTKKFEYLKIGAVNFNLFTDWTVYEQGQFCTGLKDKNGKLIYEGDIVKEILTDFINEEIITVIKWDNLNASYNLENSQNCEREVVGNIYENKSLLESEM